MKRAPRNEAERRCADQIEFHPLPLLLLSKDKKLQTRPHLPTIFAWLN
jgi:hypothetical protein